MIPGQKKIQSAAITRKNDNRNIMLNFEGANIEGLVMRDNTFTFDSSGKREPHLTIDPVRIILGIENYARTNNINNKSLILAVAFNSNGYEYAGDVEAILKDGGYQIIKRMTLMDTKYINSLHLVLSEDSTNIVVICGNNPPVNIPRN